VCHRCWTNTLGGQKGRSQLSKRIKVEPFVSLQPEKVEKLIIESRQSTPRLSAAEMEGFKRFGFVIEG